MIWDRIPKLTYISFLELRLGVYDAIASFNIGKNTSIPIFQKQKLMISSRYYLKRERGGGEGGGIQPTSPWKVIRFYWIIQIGSNSLLVSDKIKQSLSTNAHLVSPLACDFRCFPVTFNEYLRTSVLQNTCFLKFYFWFILTSEAAVRGFSPKLLFLKISQYSQENTYIYKCQSVKSA